MIAFFFSADHLNGCPAQVGSRVYAPPSNAFTVLEFETDSSLRACCAERVWTHPNLVVQEPRQAACAVCESTVSV